MRKDLISELRQKIKGILPIQKMKMIPGPQIDDLKPDFALELYINDIKIKLIGEIIEKESYSVFRKRIHHLKLFAQHNQEYVPLLVTWYLSPQKQQYCK